MKPLPVIAIIGILGLFTLPAAAQSDYPSRPVRIVVGFPPGGSTDLMARLVAPGLATHFKQQFLIDNRPGANSNVGNQIAAKAPADGYTLLAVSASFSTNVSLYPRTGYDPIRDFAPITRIAAVHNILLVHPTVPAHSLKQLVALAKARPGQLIFASTGNGSTSHLAAELLKTSVGGLDTIHVPYKGGGPAVVDIVAGNTHAMITTMPIVAPFIRNGRLRALAVASLQRAESFPEVPTFSEAGIPGFEAAAWNALLAPAGTPREIIESLNAVVVRTVRTNEVREKLKAQGAEPIGDNPTQFGSFLKEEVAKWAKVVKASGAKVD